MVAEINGDGNSRKEVEARQVQLSPAPSLSDSASDFSQGNTSEDVESPAKDKALPARGQWSAKLDFLFGCISYAVGLGNVWRFPYLVYDNGGGAFLIPFVLCIVLCGIPLFVLEVALGQYLNTGGIGIWNLVPVLKGIGFASMTMIGLCNIYYIVLIAWTLFYFVASFNSRLPWQGCENWWNTADCFEPGSADADSRRISPINSTAGDSAVKEYWERRVLAITSGLHEMGDIRWEILFYLFVAWVLVYMVIWRGLHQSGKIIWVTATFPYLILFILFIRGVTLEGASKGLWFYITPNWKKLAEAKVWVSAATQVLFAYGIGIGANVSLGSYNRYHHNFFRDSMIACCISSGTSFFAGLVIFSVLGHMAHVQDKDVAEVAKSGPGLAFLAYPEVVIRLPMPWLWAILFFFMLIILGTASQFCTVEAFVTGLVDEWPTYLRPRRKAFTLFVVVAKFALGIPLVMNGGMYVFQLMDFFSASGFSLLTVVFCEIAGLCWIYGAKKLLAHCTDMLGFKPSAWFYYSWVAIAPITIFSIFVFSIFRYEPLVYADTYTYPWWGETIGWMMAMASVACIPLYAVYYLLQQEGSFKQRWAKGITSVVPRRKETDTVCIDDDSSAMDESIDPQTPMPTRPTLMLRVAGDSKDHCYPV